MRINIPILFILFIAFSSCQSEPRHISLSEVKNYYKDLFSNRMSKIGEQASYSYYENILPQDHPFYSFVKKYPFCLEYLLWNYTNRQLLKPLKDETDSIQFNIRWIEILKSDSNFNAAFLPIAHAHLKSKNIFITDYTPPPVPILTEEEFCRTASRFYYAENVDFSKRIEWKICVGINPYHYDSGIRKYPAVEAFCLTAIFNSRNYGHWSDFEENIKTIESETKSLPDSTTLEYARQRMIEEMMKSKHLQELLIKKYKGGKDELAFVVK